MRIMIVDDSAFMRSMIRNVVVAKGGIVVGEATDGLEVISTYAECSPDLVTMDITMRNMGGLDALRELITVYPDARIIMVSAIGQPSDMIEAIRSGAVGYVWY
ncbi:response regulator [Sulfoacidibacillus ferrooxidans]|uniref:Chemotaxis protein CheY n=1 Tax=Sulfoacidibacillus ferrooxidans TaxID=2005001 RepID=A0A9X2AG20_9BACL|nr:response regulator [Sulfoacidibacillus ferrooxidans]MCI0184676.1 Chemotaxis protein CheY [Sulfoacidibacillus ferrooxidans]